VFYEVAADARDVVRVLAVDRRERNVLRIGRREIKL